MPIIAVILALGLMAAIPPQAAPANIYTPAALAAWSECDPDNIAYWLYRNTEYPEGYTFHAWEDAETCMERKITDCKCRAVIANAALESCPGYFSRIISLSNTAGQRHAVAVFRKPDGRRGFIDGTYAKDYDPGYDWTEVIEGVRPGTWRLE